jgi:hypothetical protein
VSAQYFTVIYQCEDDAAAQACWTQIRPLFMAENGNIRVIGVAKEDQMSRLNMIQDLANIRADDHETLDFIRDLLDAADIEAWRADHAEILEKIDG